MAGRLDDSGNVVVMVTTMRPDETVRVISLRKAHLDEREEFIRLTGWLAWLATPISQLPKPIST